MENELIIVESPTKAKIIKKFLGTDYEVISSMGHIRDLPPSKFGVDVEGNFKPQYEIIKGKSKVIDDLKKNIKKTSKIYLAMDEDREGEAIGWHIIHALKINEDKYGVDRIVFHEITEEAIKNSLENPRKINMDLVNAQQARRILDRIVGYRLSPLLSKKIRKGLSAGRVQSVGLKIIVVREKERTAFKIQKYFTVEGVVEKNSNDIKVKLLGKDGEKFDKLYIDTQEKASVIINELRDTEAVISEIEEKEKKHNALPPFITSTLQQEAFNRIRFNPEKTMRIAQQLYEGIDLPDGSSSGLITYMRTDSVSIAKSAITAARDYIKKNYGKDYLPEKPSRYRSKKSAQEAHECIRPTVILRGPEQMKNILSNDQYKLYELIWDRFVACQMSPSVIKSINVDFCCAGYDLRATGQTVMFNGYTKVWHASVSEIEIPAVEKGESFHWKNIEGIEHETKPPARFTPATLVKELEKNGIGRPSTYASILKTLIMRKYIVLEKGALIPQEIGIVVVDVLEKHFSRIMDKKFTAGMEDNLDEIACGECDWHKMMSEFYSRFKEHYDSAVENMDNIKDEATDIKCPDCGAPIVIKWGRNGKFYACTGYPKCKKTFNIDENGNIEKEGETDMKCPKCQSPMVIKTGRFGKFLACSAYPKCRQTFALDENGNPIFPPIPQCPQCGKDTVIRSSRKGKFLACTGYPQCRFVMNLKEAEDKNV